MKIFENLKEMAFVAKKYPLTLLLSNFTALSILFFSEYIFKEEAYFNVFVTITIGVLVYAKVEAFEFEKKIIWIVARVLSLLSILVLYLYLPEDYSYGNSSFLMALVLFLLTAIFFIPNKKISRESSVLHFSRSVISCFTSIVYSLGFYIGLILITTSFAYLFKMDWGYEMPTRLFLFVFYSFAVWYFLLGMEETKESLYSNFVKKFLNYIVLPFLCAYGVLLYMYFARLLIVREYPKGIIPFMIIAYSMAGTFYLYLADNIKEGRMNGFFKKYFYFSLIPLLPLLFYSIAARINQYGITENRYYILVGALWIAFVVIINAFYKMKHLVLVPLTFMLLLFIAFIGPFSAGKISVNSQKNRINKLLERVRTAWTDEASQEFSEMLTYFDKYHSLKDSGLTEEEYISKEDLAKKYGTEFKYEYQWENKESYEVLYPASEIVKLDGYDYLINNPYFSNDRFYEVEGFKIVMSYIESQEVIIIGENKYVLDDIRKQIFVREKDKESKDLSYVIEVEGLKIKVNFEELYSYDEGVEVYGNGMTMFIKVLP